MLFAGVLFGASSCSDMLTPDLERYAEKNGTDTIYSYLGILKSVQNIAERNVILGETRGDLVATTEYTSDSISHLFNFEDQLDGDYAILRAADYYNVINQCNFYLHNCDSGAVKDQYKYMQKEWAQVQAIRAWTYMQLVNNYGSVPFVTEPVESSTEGIELDKNAPRISKDNIATLLSEAGLYRAYEIQYLTSGTQGYPSYGSFGNGSVSIPARSCFLPVPLVMADLYLMQNEYKKAAAMYYTFLREEASSMPSNSMVFSEMIGESNTSYMPGGTWINLFSSYSVGSTGDEVIALVPGAASTANGTIFTQIANIYGFRTSTTSGTVGSGSTSVTPDETYRQLGPSKNYLDLNAEQLYCSYLQDGGVEVQEYYEGVGDARLHGSAPLNRIEGLDYNFITKYTPVRGLNFNFASRKAYATGFSTYYAVRTYRKALVQLRFAEAINRAGFPEHAFSILKDGIATDNYPTLAYHDIVKIDTLYDGETGEALLDSLGNVMTETDTVAKDVPYLIKPEAEAGGAYYISVDEMVRASTQANELNVNNFLDFSQSEFRTDVNNVIGIHGRGCGETRGYRDTLYTYDRCVAQKIAAKRAAAESQTEEWQEELADSLNRVTIVQAVADGTITQEEVIDAVEDIIIDECALETAFEGNRYYDLLRFANHKGNGMIDNEWLARKIASRGYAPNTGYDAALYGRLVGGELWYLSLPKD